MLKDCIRLLLLVCLSTTLNAQLSQIDWNLDDETSRNLTSSDTPFFNELPEHFRTATLDVEEVFLNIKKERQRIDLPNSKGEFESFEIWPVDVVPKEMSNPRSAKTFRGEKLSDPEVKVSFTIFDKAVYAAIYAIDEIEYISPASYENNISIIYSSKNERHPYVMCGVEDIHEKSRNHAAHHHRTDNLRTIRAAISTSGEYSQEFGGTPYDAQAVLNSITAGIMLLNPILERDLNINLINVTTTSIIYSNPSSDPYTNINNGELLLSQSQNIIDTQIGSANYDIGHLLIWQNLGGLAYVGVVCSSTHKARGYSGISTSFNAMWIDYAAHEMGHQLGMRHNHSTIPNCNTTDNFRFEPGDGSTIMSYSGLCQNSYQNNTDPYYHIASIERYNVFDFNCAVDGNTVNNPTVSADVSTITIPKSTPFVLVGSGNATTYNWNQYDGAGPGESGSPSGTCDNCANFKYAVPTSETYRHFPDLNYSITNGGNDAIWEKLSSIPRTMNFKLVGRDNPGIGTDDVVVNISNNGPLEITYPNGGEQLSGNTTITTTWNVNGTQNEAATVDIFITTDGGVTFDLIIGNTPNDGTQNISIPNIISTESYIVIQGHVNGSTFRGGSTFYDVSNEAFGIGSSPITPPSNDDYADAIQGYFNDIFTGDLEYSTLESTPALSCSQVMITGDVWYKYEIGNPVAGEEFRVIVDFLNSGDYGMELTIPSINYAACYEFSQNTNVGLILQSDLPLGSIVFVRVFEKSPGAERTSINTRTPELFTISSEGASVLPIKLERFSGERVGRNVEVSWTTLSEINSSHFDLLGSVNGEDWNKIETVKAQGNSTSKTNYSVTDRNSQHEYYRLRSVDFDGSLSFSKVIYIPNEQTELKIFPNPADNEIHIQFPSEEKHNGFLMISDQQGRQIMTIDVSRLPNSQVDLDVSSYQSGLYFISYFGDKSWSKRVIVK